MEASAENAEIAATVGFMVMSILTILCAIASALIIYFLHGIDRRARQQDQRIRDLEETPGVAYLLRLKQMADNGKH